MQDRFAEPLTIIDIANELDVSVRTLQHSFNKAYGHSPRDVLNGIRLEVARSR